MYARILVAVDGSETSERCLHEAIALAADQKARLRIVHVVDAGQVYTELPYARTSSHRDEWTAAGLAVLSKAGDQARAAGLTAEAVEVEILDVGESIAGAIVGDAVTWGADLLVVGTHGRSGLMHVLMGSVAEGIIRISPIPMLMIRRG